MKTLTSRKARLAAAVAAVAGTILISTPASAFAATASCSASQEVCRVSTSTTSSSVFVTTKFSSVTSSNTQYYDVRQGTGTTGPIICSGSMGYNQTKVCNLGSYRGSVVFRFNPGGGVSGTLSI